MGAEDDGTPIGINRNMVKDMKKNFVNQLNNPDKMSPTLYLSLEELEYEGVLLLWVYVPPTSTVEKCVNRIYDRNEDGDMDITNSPIQLQNMYNRKSNTYAEHKIFPYVTTEDLRMDLMDKVRNLAKSKNLDHPWLKMSDEEILKSAGLWEKDFSSGIQGYNLAGVLLFGKDEVIRSCCPGYITDAIYRVENLDRYDLTDGHEYKYTVSEDTVEGYKSEQNENNFTNTIEQDNTVIVSGNKTWVTPVGTTHPTVTINLLKNGEQYKTTTIANGNTTYEFTGLPKYKTDANGNFVLDVNGNIELNEYTVEEVELNGYTSEKAANGVDFVNTIDQELISISGEKTWVDPEGTTLVHPEITINLIKNGTKASTIKLANGNTKYEFTELPKYKTDENGKYVLDSNGNVQLNRYTIEEENVRNYTTSYNGYNITNTFNQDIQGTVEITTTTTSQTSVKTPLDVVFVLDISGSMNDNDKDKTMVDSVNTAISTIMNENPESRIGVVAYSSTYNSSLANANNATTLLPLGKYTPKTTGKYLTLQEGVLRGNNETYDTITTNVNEKKNQTLNVYGGTYTQAGIKEGAGILTSANTKFTTTVNGKQKEITRTPVMILLSDGDPTYYNESYTTLSGKKYGNGSETTENEAYYTIRTANYYKQQITSHYYGTTGTKSKFYTIGLNMSGTLSETILNPTSENVNKCNNEGTEGGYFTWRNVKGKLYDKIIADGSAGKYSYADQSYVGSMTTSDLQSIFNTIINDNSTSTETRDITVEESDARRVNLEGIDTSKEFTLTIGSHSYNFAQAQTAGYVKGNNTDGYYVDISNVAKGTTISISYNK